MVEDSLRVRAAVATAEDVFRLAAAQIEEVKKLQIDIGAGQETVDRAQAIADGLADAVTEQIGAAQLGVAADAAAKASTAKSEAIQAASTALSSALANVGEAIQTSRVEAASLADQAEASATQAASAALGQAVAAIGEDIESVATAAAGAAAQARTDAVADLRSNAPVRLDTLAKVATALAEWRTISAPTTVEPGERILADTSGTAFAATLPLNAAEGVTVSFADPKGTWAAKPLTLAGNGRTFTDGSASLACNINHAELRLVVRGGQWRF